MCCRDTRRSVYKVRQPTEDQMAKWFPKSEYQAAHRYAVETARALGGKFDIGIEVFAEYGRPGFRSGFILPKPKNRSGFELRCEVVSATDPL